MQPCVVVRNLLWWVGRNEEGHQRCKAEVCIRCRMSRAMSPELAYVTPSGVEALSKIAADTV